MSSLQLRETLHDFIQLVEINHIIVYEILNFCDRATGIFTCENLIS